MLFGMPPYFNRNKEQLFENIRRAPLYIPTGTPPEVTNFIVKLLHRDPKKRLGSGPDDAEEIKREPFFAGLNWDDVYARKLKPPKAMLRPILNTELSKRLFEDVCGNGDGRKIERWSFIASDF